ncbi:MAG: ASKHA domain-containing protein [Lachnospiraceae bacterium]
MVANSILEKIQKENKNIEAPCGGNGTCGKCKIKVTKGSSFVTMQDLKVFSREELDLGYRLACVAKYKQGMEYEIIRNEENMFIVGNEEKKERKLTCNGSIAIDIGTTTIAMNLVENGSKNICKEYRGLNHQRVYGADVLSRIRYANDGNQEVLKECIKKDLNKGINKLIAKEEFKIELVTIAANMTMIHLLLGFSTKELGEYPFLPVNKEEITINSKSLLGDTCKIDCDVVILPAFSAFVGGDIISDLFFLEAYKEEKISLLIDLGTNGEMVLFHKNKMISTSVAAGPAFEGGNIKCGTGSILGAISEVIINGSNITIGTIGNHIPPTGICGTGVLEAISQFMKENIIDETGLLEAKYFETGFVLYKDQENSIYLTQSDIRQIQLAKGAIRAGIELLLETFGIYASEVEQVYLAGGFGEHVKEEVLISTGILPKEFEGKIKGIGNGALKGAIEYQNVIEKNSFLSHIQSIREINEELSLATHPKFQESYLKYLNF